MAGKTVQVKIAVVAAAMLAVSAVTVRAEPVRIRLSFIVPVANWATMLFKTPGLARHLEGRFDDEQVLNFRSGCATNPGSPLLPTPVAYAELLALPDGFDGHWTA